MILFIYSDLWRIFISIAKSQRLRNFGLMFRCCTSITCAAGLSTLYFFRCISNCECLTLSSALVQLSLALSGLVRSICDITFASTVASIIQWFCALHLRPYFHVELYLRICLFTYLPIYQFMYLSNYAFYIFTYLCIYAFRHVSIYIFTYLCIYVFMYICIYTFMYPCISLFMYLCIYFSFSTYI